MNVQLSLLSTLFFIGISISAVSCLQCHVCNTINPGEDDCMTIDETSTKYLTNCTEPHIESCRIQEQWVDFTVLNQTTSKRTVRQCASTKFDPDRPCYYRTGFGGRVSVCNCIGDGCNEASRTASTVLMTIALLFLIKLLS